MTDSEDYRRLQGWTAKYDAASVHPKAGAALSLYALLGHDQHPSVESEYAAKTMHASTAAHSGQREPSAEHGGVEGGVAASSDQLRGALKSLYDKYRKLKHDSRDHRKASTACFRDGMAAPSAGDANLRIDLQLLARRAQDAEERGAELRRELESEKRSREAGERVLLETRMKVGVKKIVICTRSVDNSVRVLTPAVGRS
jgi:hypothetical protein